MLIRLQDHKPSVKRDQGFDRLKTKPGSHFTEGLYLMIGFV